MPVTTPPSPGAGSSGSPRLTSIHSISGMDRPRWTRSNMSRSSGVPKFTKSSSTRSRSRSISAGAPGAEVSHSHSRVRSTASGSITSNWLPTKIRLGNSDRFNMLPVARSSWPPAPDAISADSSGSRNGTLRMVAHGPWGIPGRWSTTMWPLPSASDTIGVAPGSRASTVSTSTVWPRVL